MADLRRLGEIAALMRYLILRSTTTAGSGHPTSSLSGVELVAGLLFGGFFRFNAARPGHPNNDRLIFSKGHAAPLLYAAWAAAGRVSEEELLSLRKFGSPLEGHPAMTFPYTEAATGSLGQGLSIGVGMALNARFLDRLPYRTYVLLGDSEMAEGAQWEAIALAAHYRLDNLIAMLDVNRLGQRGETMHGHDIGAYAEKVSAFGWETFSIDGHSFPEILNAYDRASKVRNRPAMIIAKTVKGRGVSFIEERNGWHGKALGREELGRALEEMGDVDRSIRGTIALPEDRQPERAASRPVQGPVYPKERQVSTRLAYGRALARIFPEFPDMVVLDAEVSNSTYSEVFRDAWPGRFFEMFVAEQNMVGAAIGLSRRGKIPFVSSFAAFLTRAADQIRMSQYSDANIKFCGSHAGVSIGEDGPSQMGLEDLALFRSILGGVVLYPSDAVSTERLVEEAAGLRGIVYIRTTRRDTPVLYSAEERFQIGGSKVLRRSGKDRAAIVAAGITLHEALAAADMLAKEGIAVRVIDLYSIKPVDGETLRQAASDTGVIVTAEDHFAEGGLGEAVMSAIAGRPVPVHLLAVRRMPKSGKPDELLEYEGISREAIAAKLREVC